MPARLVTACLLLATMALGADYRVPLMGKPPTLDGRIDAAEWATAAGFSGFAMNGQLERRRVQAFVGATASHLLIAVKSQLPDDGELLTKIQKDTVKLVFDDSIEVWVDPTPGTEHGQTFQMLFNAAGRRGYKHHARGRDKENPTWQGNWQVANGLHDGWWHAEVAIPIAELPQPGAAVPHGGRTSDQGVWGINVCRNWKQPWAFSSLGGGPYAPEGIRFTFAKEGALVVRHEVAGDPVAGKQAMTLVLTNPSARPIAAKAEMVIQRDAMPELRAAEDRVVVAPGATQKLTINADDQVTKKFALTIGVSSADGKTPLYQRSYAWKLGKPWKWTTRKEQVLPIDLQFAYYPYTNRLRVLADVRNLPEKARLDRLVCVVRKKGTAKPVKTLVFDRFENERQELTADLPPLEGTYEIAARAEGRDVPEGEIVKEFERTVYEWERKGLGTSTKVYPPFTPIQVEGSKVSTVLREHTMNDFGLWDQVVATGQPLLAAPMRYVVTSGGKAQEVKASSLAVPTREPHRAIAQARWSAGPVTAQATATWDYDGVMRMDLSLQRAKVDALYLEIPLRDAMAPLIHAMGDGIRNTVYIRVPEGQGVVWDSTKVQVNDFPRNWCSYIYVGSPSRGLCWFAENDAGGSWNSEKPNVELVRQAKQLILRVHFINQPTEITAPRTLTFGLLAAPVKPRIANWRYAWHRENYTLLGTDINWLARGNCGSVYPAGKDLHLWEMLKRGNREKLSREEVNKVIEHGRKYFEPYGPDYVERFTRHVPHNLLSRHGTKMVFYYNRASCQLFDEFQTFQDEWCLTDYRTVGKGNSVGEIKIIPTASYIDHALWWYAKSFDVGGNQGVYWDNMYFRASHNTAMTAAYRRPDGTFSPSTGLWGLRELVKRSFVLMNERGMRPITMPHMTSTGILPVYSFATVQYDWEWKYSRGDVQYRFPREYLLLVSTGELAGAWPVLLGDHGKLARDEWTQRTFAAVCLVHELDGWGYGKAWNSLFTHVHRLVETPGLDVYRYWDDRPQAVSSGHVDLPTIVYALKGKEAYVGVTSYAEQDLPCTLRIDAAALGLAGGYHAVDAETDEPVAVKDNTVEFVLKKHDVRAVRLLAGER
ncbi:MAG: hypothetical protein ISS72_02135 [Candidatus Brocadiae bacterium]|nr:hypothetical protein [Candidatus Brocadiia bacterium]